MSVHGPCLADSELLRRGVARREDRRHGPGAVGHGGTRGAEVDQGRLAVGAEHDVGGLDVAMQEARLVHLLQAGEQRPQHRLQPGRRQRPSALTRSSERPAAQQLHDDVGGAVGLEEVEHLHDRRRLVQVGQRAALLDEAAAAPAEIVGHLGRARQHRAAVLADGQRRRQVFLDGDVATELRVARKIGDAESALAQHAHNLVAADQGARRQRHIVDLCRGVDGRRGGGGHMMRVSGRATRPPLRRCNSHGVVIQEFA